MDAKLIVTLNALKVIYLDPRIHGWLAENDPKALEQVEAAIASVTQTMHPFIAGSRPDACHVCGNVRGSIIHGSK